MKAVIIGATGATGSALVQLLLEDETFSEVKALVRRPLQQQHPKLITRVIDFNQPEKWQHEVTGDVAFSCLGTTLKDAGSKVAQYKVDYEYQYAFAKAARDNNVPYFMLISASMANPKSLVFYSRMKGQLEKAITALHFEHLIIFRPGLLSRPDTQRKGEKISESIVKWLNNVGLLKNMSPLPVRQLAQLMLHYAKNKFADSIQIVESARILSEVKMLS